MKTRDEAAKAQLNRFGRLLMQLTRHELNGQAEFLSDSAFRLKLNPFPPSSQEIPLGLYELPQRSGEAHLYRLQHPLAENVLTRSLDRELPVAEVTFNYAEREGRISILEPFLGQTGWLQLSLLSVESFDQAEDRLIFAALTDTGQPLDEDWASKLMNLPGQVGSPCHLPEEVFRSLDAQTLQHQQTVQREVSERNARYFELEADKLDGWADDLKLGLEREIKEIDRQIKEARRAATTAFTLEENSPVKNRSRRSKRCAIRSAARC